MKKILILLLLIIFAFSMTAIGTGCKEEASEEVVKETTKEATEEEAITEEKEPVTLTYGTWNAEWVDNFDTIFDVFEAQNPYITVEVEVIQDTEYDAVIQTDFELGKGPDVVQARSYDISRTLYDTGTLVELNEENVPALANYDDVYIGGWRTEDGIIYGIPYMISSHGVFYNTEIFAQHNLTEPETWEEFMAICETLQANEILPFTDGGLTGWIWWATWYPGLGANFYGGEDARQKLMSGEMKFTDQPFVDAFEAMLDLAQYHVDDFLALDYMEGINIFAAGEGAMLIDGGWSEGLFKGAEFEVGWFGPPVVNSGDTPWYNFHLDNGLAINKSSQHPAEALLLLNWMAGEEFAQVFLNNIPGEFLAIPGDYEINSSLMQDELDFAKNANLTIRIMQEKLNGGEPSGQILMEQAFDGLFTGKLTPIEAVQLVQDGLASWYEPLMD